MTGVAVVTGGAGSLGRSVARALARDGYVPALLDRRADALRDASAELDDAETRCVDVADADALRREVDDVSAARGPIEILVTAAGYSPKGAGGRRPVAHEIAPDEWRTVTEVNLSAAFYAARAVLPHMLERGFGRIVNVSSTAGLVGSPTAGLHYCAAKMGVVGLTRALSGEVAGSGVLVNAVAPGKLANPDWPDAPDAAATYAARVPVGRLGEPGEVAVVVAWLASRANTYVTGATIVVDGGRVAWQW